LVYVAVFVEDFIADFAISKAVVSEVVAVDFVGVGVVFIRPKSCDNYPSYTVANEVVFGKSIVMTFPSVETRQVDTVPSVLYVISGNI
jgi:hypothetical protein